MTAAAFFLAVLLFWQQPGSTRDLAAARQAEQAGDFRTAESIYLQLLSRQPDPQLYQRLGLVRQMQNKFSSAAEAFGAALKLDPALWSSQLFLGIDFYRLGSFPQAEAHLTKANQLHPKEPEVMFWLGATKLARHDYLSGFAMLETLLQRDPGNTEALRLLAEAYATYGTSLLNEVGTDYPQSPAGLTVAGKAFEFQGNYADALQAYRSALAIDSRRPAVLEAVERIESRLKSGRAATH